jgi:Sporulation and spore germination
MKRLLGASVLALMFGGCVMVPSDSAPTVTPRHDVPFGLLSSAPPTTVLPGQTQTSVVVWLLDAVGGPTPALRVTSPHHTLTTILHLLVDGPTPVEAASGLTTAVPASLDLSVIGAQGSSVTVRFSPNWRQFSARTQRRAVAQIFRTLHTAVGVTRLRGDVGSTAVALPLPHGGSARLLRWSDFAP